MNLNMNLKENKFISQLAEKIKQQEEKERNNKIKCVDTFLNFSKVKINKVNNAVFVKEVKNSSEFETHNKKNKLKINFCSFNFNFEKLPDMNTLKFKTNKNFAHRERNKKQNKTNTNLNSTTIQPRLLNIFLISEQSTMVSKPTFSEKIILKTRKDFNSNTLQSQFREVFSKSMTNLLKNQEEIKNYSAHVKINQFDIEKYIINYTCNIAEYEFRYKNMKTITKSLNTPVQEKLSFISTFGYQFDKYGITLEKVKNFINIETKVGNLCKIINTGEKGKENKNIFNFENNIQNNNSEDKVQFIDLHKGCGRFYYPAIPNYLKNSAKNSSSTLVQGKSLNFIYDESLMNIFSHDPMKVNFNIKRISRFKSSDTFLHKKFSFLHQNFKFSNLNEQTYSLREICPNFKFLQSSEQNPNKNKNSLTPKKLGSKRKYSEITIINSSHSNNISKSTSLSTYISSLPSLINTYKLINNQFSNCKSYFKEFLKISTNTNEDCNFSKASQTLSELFRGVDIIINSNIAILLLNPLHFSDELDARPFESLYETIKKNYLSYERIFIILLDINPSAVTNKTLQLVSSFINKNCISFKKTFNFHTEISVSKFSNQQDLHEFVVSLNAEKFLKFKTIGSDLLEESDFILKKFPVLNLYEVNTLCILKEENMFDSFLDLLIKKYEGKLKLQKDLIKNTLFFK